MGIKVGAFGFIFLRKNGFGRRFFRKSIPLKSVPDCRLEKNVGFEI